MTLHSTSNVNRLSKCVDDMAKKTYDQVKNTSESLHVKGRV